jgi:hypothetical protein
MPWVPSLADGATIDWLYLVERGPKMRRSAGIHNTDKGIETHTQYVQFCRPFNTRSTPLGREPVPQNRFQRKRSFLPSLLCRPHSKYFVSTILCGPSGFHGLPTLRHRRKEIGGLFHAYLFLDNVETTINPRRGRDH